MRPKRRSRRWYRRVYLHSDHWLALRMWALERAAYRCERCRRPRTALRPLDVHHKSYAHLFAERPSDVRVLCRECHEQDHAEGKSWWRRLLGV